MQKQAYPPAPDNKKQYIEEIGKVLIETYGKQEFYSPEEVKQSHQKGNYAWDYSSWAMCIFCSHEAFDAYHKQQDKPYDYQGMRKEMLEGFDKSIFLELLTIPDFNMDGSWIYLIDTMASIGEGISDLASGVGKLFSGLTDLFDL